MNQHILSKQLVQRDVLNKEPAQSLGEVFLTAASSLFIIAARMHQLSRAVDPVELQQSLIHHIHQFEHHLQQKNVRAEQVLIAKYFLCALLDDVVEHDWLGNQGLWRAYSLLFHFFQESSQDERVIVLIDRLQQEPTMNIALLEFAYMTLLYGYQGQWRHSPQGYFKVLEKIDELYHVLIWHYGDFRKSLFIRHHET